MEPCFNADELPAVAAPVAAVTVAAATVAYHPTPTFSTFPGSPHFGQAIVLSAALVQASPKGTGCGT